MESDDGWNRTQQRELALTIDIETGVWVNVHMLGESDTSNFSVTVVLGGTHR